jgi:hypothetical protein
MWSVKHIISFPSYKINFHRQFLFQNYSTNCCRTCDQLSVWFPSPVTKLTFTYNFFFKITSQNAVKCDQLSIWFPSPVTKLTFTDNFFSKSTKCCRTCDQLSILFPSPVTKLTFTDNFFFLQNYGTKCCRTCDQLSLLFLPQLQDYPDPLLFTFLQESFCSKVSEKLANKTENPYSTEYTFPNAFHAAVWPMQYLL